MKLVCLLKRRPQGRDLFTQPYGRFYYLFDILAQQGYEVHLLLLSYQSDTSDYRRTGNLHWYSIPAIPRGIWPYFSLASRLVRSVKPDWIIGLSDIWYGILAQHLAKRHGIRCLLDAYDNYESYIPWLKPLHWAWRHALFSADLVTAAGPQLAEFMRITSGRAEVSIIPMAADPIFKPMDKVACRMRLSLPLETVLLGYAGALHPNRGISLLFQVFANIRAVNPKVQLVLSGRLAPGVRLPDGVLWLGYRPPEEVPLIMNSLDLLLVLNKRGDFGDFSYPAKLYEAMACNVPVVAADVPGTSWILREFPSMLARPEDECDFVEKSIHVLQVGRIDYPNQVGWQQSAQLLKQLLEQ